MPYSCVHLEGNRYAVYYTYGHSGCTFIPQYKAEVEYNPGQPTKFLSLTTDNVASYEMERTKSKSVTLDAFVTGAVDKATALDGLRAESIAAAFRAHFSAISSAESINAAFRACFCAISRAGCYIFLFCAQKSIFFCARQTVQ